MAEEIGLYADAYIYDILHTPGTALEVDGLVRTESLFVRTPHRSRLWLEPACGTGRYLRVAGARGVDCIGFDQSETMIAYARQRAERARWGSRPRYFVGSMTDFAADVGQGVSFAFNLINTIRHLESDRAMLAHFKQIARVLAPGGVYAVGISLADYGREAVTRDTWMGVRGRCRVVQRVRYTPALRGRRERVASRLTITRTKTTERRESVYTLRSYSRDQWICLIERSPLRLIATVNAAGSPIPIPRSGYAVFVLGRRGRVRAPVPTG